MRGGGAKFNFAPGRQLLSLRHCLSYLCPDLFPSHIDVDTLKWLVTNGGDVTRKSNKGGTALDIATKLGHNKIKNYLRSCGKLHT